jgi:hypothetical protein
MWGRFDSILADIPEAKQDDRQDRSSTVENSSKILEELLVLARQQSISSSDAFKYFVDKLQEQSYELNSALNLAFPESAESRRAFNDLSRNWDNFLEAWTKFNASSKIAGIGLAITDYETMVLLEAIIELHKPISVLLDQTRTRASREALGATFRHFLRVEPTQAQQAALGGALDLRNAPPRGALDLRNAPPGAADETSPKPGE